jgi:phage protein D/phage baseplate assembly protein gpV
MAQHQSQGSPVPQYRLRINDADAPQEVVDSLLEFTVENSLHLPDMCSLHLRDLGFRWADSEHFREGVKIEVKIGQESEPLQRIFLGEVVGLELDMAAEGTPMLLVRCYDFSHRLQRNPLRRTFVQMTDSDIFKQVAEAAGFTPHADASPVVHDWVGQFNQSNWDFLNDRADRIGFRMYLQNERDLYFVKVEDGSTPPIPLEWGTSLRSFRPRLSAPPQVNEVVVLGWDPVNKETVIGKAERPVGLPTIGEQRRGGQIAQKAFGPAISVGVFRPVTSTQAADRLAQSILDDIAGSYIEADGLCFGNQRIVPNALVELKKIGDRFGGTYYVTATTHRFSPVDGFSTRFSISSKRANTILALLTNQREADNASPSRIGMVNGIVTDNNDPLGLGRVKVKYPGLTDEETSFWGRLVTPMGGPGRGIEFIPEIDDEVVVFFLHGDQNLPYIFGSVWSLPDHAPLSSPVAGGKVERRVIRTRTGNQLLFDDAANDITLTTPANYQLGLQESEQSARLVSAKGRALNLSDKEQMAALVGEGGSLIIDDKGQQIVLSDYSGNEVRIDFAAKGIFLKSSLSVEIESTRILLQGTQVQISGAAQVDIGSAGIVTIEAPLVKIN